MGYQREETSNDISVHIGRGEISGSAKTTSHEYSNGDYAVVRLLMPGMDITLFPGMENVESLAAALTMIAADLTRIAEGFKVLALED